MEGGEIGESDCDISPPQRKLVTQRGSDDCLIRLLNISGAIQAGLEISFSYLWIIYIEDFPRPVSLFWLLNNFCIFVTGIFMIFNMSSRHKRMLRFSLMLAIIAAAGTIVGLMWQDVNIKVFGESEDSTVMKWCTMIHSSIMLMMTMFELLVISLLLMNAGENSSKFSKDSMEDEEVEESDSSSARQSGIGSTDKQNRVDAESSRQLSPESDSTDTVYYPDKSDHKYTDIKWRTLNQKVKNVPDIAP